MITSSAITADETPGTYSNVLALQIQSETGSNLLFLSHCKYEKIAAPRYKSEMDASSYDSYTTSFNENLSNPTTIEDILSKLHAKLSESQEDLGHEFKSIYFKNAWDLYEN